MSSVRLAQAIAFQLGEATTSRYALFIAVLDRNDYLACALHRAGASHPASRPSARAPGNSGHAPLSDSCKEILGGALQEAIALGHGRIDSEHLLLALTAAPGDRLLAEFASLNVSAPRLRNAVLDTLLAGYLMSDPADYVQLAGFSADRWLREVTALLKAGTYDQRETRLPGLDILLRTGERFRVVRARPAGPDLLLEVITADNAVMPRRVAVPDIAALHIDWSAPAPGLMVSSEEPAEDKLT